MTQLDVIGPQDLHDRTVIAVTGDHSVDRQLQAVMSQAGTKLHHTASSYYYAIARAMVASGSYVSVIDPVNGKAALADGVVWRPFVPKIVHELAIVTSQGRPLGIAASNFKDRILDALSNHVI